MKRFVRRCVAFFVSAVLLITACIPTSAVADINNKSDEDSIRKWVSEGIIAGYSDGSLRVDSNLTRAQFASILNKIFGITEKLDMKFKDVADRTWYSDAVYKVASAGIIAGDDNGNFKPENFVNREEAAVMLAKAFNVDASNEKYCSNISDEALISPWAKKAVSAMTEKGYMAVSGNKFIPHESVSRAEFVRILDNLLKGYIKESGTYSNDVTGNLLINKSGVILKNINISGDLYIAQGAGKGEITLDNATITGRIIVFGNVENSVVLKNTIVKNCLIVKKQNGVLRISADGSTSVPLTQLYSGVKLETGSLGKAEVLFSKAGQEIKLDGNFKQVEVKSASGGMLTLGGAVEALLIREKAENTILNVLKDAEINAAILDVKNIQVKGEGRIKLAKIGAQGITFEHKPDKLEASIPQITVSVAGKEIKLEEAATTQSPTTSSTPVYTQPVSDSITISKAEYLDKTLAGILGHIAGVLTGYEFVGGQAPIVGLPDDWFSLTYGPYGGGQDKHGSAGENRVEAAGRILSDDDYHIDFFNQHILDAHGPDTTNLDIRKEWIDHQVSDWGGGDKAMRLMNSSNIVPPYTGTWESGNQYYWCSEPYIEQETLGMNAPGMPMTASKLAKKFASLTGDFDGVTWASFLATLYSVAYFESDARTALEKSAEMLPKNGWPYQIYKRCVELHSQNPTDWRWAAKELAKVRRGQYASNDVNVSPDVDNGFVMLAILYGQNDYIETCKIASLAGFDGDCTAASVTGLMGIIKGMAGTPQVVKDRIYANGSGVYINDMNFTPHIGKDYPAEQTWNSLAELYQKNAEDQISARGGSVGSDGYVIKRQKVLAPEVVIIKNYDFEKGNLEGWNVWKSSDPGGNISVQNNGKASSGLFAGVINTDANAGEGKLYVTLNGLEDGATYKATGYVSSSYGREVRLYAENNGSTVYSRIGSASGGWFSRSVVFTVRGTTAQVGLHLPEDTSGASWGSIDDLMVEKLPSAPKGVQADKYEFEDGIVTGGEVITPTRPEELTLTSNGKYVGNLNDDSSNVKLPNVYVNGDGIYILKVTYANGMGSNSSIKLSANEGAAENVICPDTYGWGPSNFKTVSCNVRLNAGYNALVINKGDQYVQIDCVEVAAAKDATKDNLVKNSSFEADGVVNKIVNDVTAGTVTAPTAWGVWPGSKGTDADASHVELDGHTGNYRLTHFKNANYEVMTDQTITSLSNGTYKLSAWTLSGGGQDVCIMSAKNYGAAVPELTSDIPASKWPNWTKVEISNIPVTNGQCTIGFYSKGGAYKWASFDDVELIKTSDSIVDSKTKYEAENTVITNAVIKADPQASEGKSVGDINKASSSVEFQNVKVDKSGVYKINVAYASNLGDKAWYDLSVNGEAPITLDLTNTGGWSNFSTASVNVELIEGNNTLKFSKGALFGVIDYITVEPGTGAAAYNEGIVNYAKNHGFESDASGTQTPVDWNTWGGPDGKSEDADFIEEDCFTGDFRLTHYKASDYTVFTGQTITGLENGIYSLSAWVRSEGVKNSCFVSAKNYGGSELKADIPENGAWTKIEIPYINVTNGQCEIGFYSDATAGSWAGFDEVSFTKVKYEAEKAILNKVSRNRSNTASGYAFAGGIDKASSSIDFQNIYVDQDGIYTVKVRYANAYQENGLTLPAWHYVSVNGGSPVIVEYPIAGAWGKQFEVTSFDVRLKAGNNTLKFSKGALYAELDCIEILPSINTTGLNDAAPIINYVQNGDFEAEGSANAPAHWDSVNTSQNQEQVSAFVEGSAFTGEYRLTHYMAKAYKVYTCQTVTGLENGVYALSAWVVSGGGYNESYMSAKGFGADAAELKVNIPGNGWPKWTRIEIGNIAVTNGQCTVGFYSDSVGNNWTGIDNVQLIKVN